MWICEEERKELARTKDELDFATAVNQQQ